MFYHYTRQGSLVFPTDWVLPLETALRGFLHDIEGHYLVTPRSASMIQMYHVAQTMIERLVLGLPIESIVNDWLTLISTRRASVVAVVGLWGVQVAEPIHFAPHLTLVSSQDVPATKEREGLFQIGRTGEPIFRVGLFQEYHRVPNAALLIEIPNLEVLQDSTASIDRSTFQSNFFEIQTKVFAAIALCSGAYPVPNWTYEVVAHPAISYSGLGGSAATGTFMSPRINSTRSMRRRSPTFTRRSTNYLSRVGNQSG